MPALVNIYATQTQQWSMYNLNTFSQYTVMPVNVYIDDRGKAGQLPDYLWKKPREWDSRNPACCRRSLSKIRRRTKNAERKQIHVVLVFKFQIKEISYLIRQTPTAFAEKEVLFFCCLGYPSPIHWNIAVNVAVLWQSYQTGNGQEIKLLADTKKSNQKIFMIPQWCNLLQHAEKHKTSKPTRTAKNNGV